MERLKELVDLCNERKKLFNDQCLFFNYEDEKREELTQKIKRLANRYEIYAVNDFDSNINIAFNSVKALKKFTGEELLKAEPVDSFNKMHYSATFFEGALILYCYENIEEEHKNAQAI